MEGRHGSLEVASPLLSLLEKGNAFRTQLYACCTQEILISDTLLTGKHVSVGMYARGEGK